MRKAYAIMKIDDAEYKLKLSAAASIEAEKKLGMGLFEALSDMESVYTQVIILWAALQKFQHKITVEKAEDIYDDYMDSEDGGIENFTEIIKEAIEASGFFKKDAETEDAEEV